MDINELTIGQVKELAAMFGGNPEITKAHPYVGKYVIVRCHDAGVHAGVLTAANGREATLHASRRLWQWKAAKEAFLSGVARHGLGDGSRVGGCIDVHLTETCEIILCSNAARNSIEQFPTHTP